MTHEPTVAELTNAKPDPATRSRTDDDTRTSSVSDVSLASYTYDPTSIPTLENLSLGDHVETFSYSIADGHGDVSRSAQVTILGPDPLSRSLSSPG